MRALTFGVVACVAALAGSSGATAAPEASGASSAGDAARIAEAVAQWGLLGTWAPDCATPSTQGNTHNTWVRRGRDVFFERELEGGRDSSRVSAASRLPDGAIEVHVEFKAFSMTMITKLVRGEDGRIRVFVNHDTRDNYSVKDGKLTSNGAVTPWQTHCR